MNAEYKAENHLEPVLWDLEYAVSVSKTVFCTITVVTIKNFIIQLTIPN